MSGVAIPHLTAGGSREAVHDSRWVGETVRGDFVARAAYTPQGLPLALRVRTGISDGAVSRDRIAPTQGDI
jgi:hypothetical protein